jgi:hypothetical protein
MIQEFLLNSLCYQPANRHTTLILLAHVTRSGWVLALLSVSYISFATLLICICYWHYSIDLQVHNQENSYFTPTSYIPAIFLNLSETSTSYILLSKNQSNTSLLGSTDSCWLCK